MTLAKIKKEHHMLEFAYSEDHFQKKITSSKNIKTGSEIL